MDIWEKLQAVEQNFFAIEQQLQAAARTLPDPIFVVDESGKFEQVIGSKERSLFRSVEFITGKKIQDILEPSLAEKLLQTLSEAITNNNLKTIEYEIGPGDITGSTEIILKENQWFEGRFYPIKDRNNEIHSVVWLSINITEKKELEEQLKELSEKDALTGACNRRYFMQIFDKQFAIVKRYKAKLSVLLIDIDNFKKINDTCGYECGDTILKRFGVFCEEHFRQSDLFARYAGEEFVVMLSSTPSLGAAIIAERLRASIEEMTVAYEKKVIRFSISIGISSVLDTDQNSNAVMRRAEAALYQAKKKGGNRIEIT
jgi:diguanylate cyclase (GGDEF)-like protein/PAS domain S-box-containing protein